VIRDLIKPNSDCVLTSEAMDSECSFIESLPDEVMAIIFESIECAQLIEMRRVCRQFKSVIDWLYPIQLACLSCDDDFETHEYIDDKYSSSSENFFLKLFRNCTADCFFVHKLPLSYDLRLSFTSMFSKLECLIIYFKDTCSNKEVDVRLLAELPKLTKLRVSRCQLIHSDRVRLDRLDHLVLLSSDFPAFWNCAPNISCLKCSFYCFKESIETSSSDEPFARLRKLTLFDVFAFSLELESLLNEKFVNLIKLTCVFFKFKKLKPLRFIRSLKVLSLKSNELESNYPKEELKPVIDLCRELSQKYEPNHFQIRINSMRFIDEACLSLQSLTKHLRIGRADETEEDGMNLVRQRLNEVEALFIIVSRVKSMPSVLQLFFEEYEDNFAILWHDRLPHQQDLAQLPSLIPNIVRLTVFVTDESSVDLDLPLFNLTDMAIGFKQLECLSYKASLRDSMSRLGFDRQVSQIVTELKSISTISFHNEDLSAFQFTRIRDVLIERAVANPTKKFVLKFKNASLLDQTLVEHPSNLTFNF
jgi:hypothetical protein